MAHKKRISFAEEPFMYRFYRHDVADVYLVKRLLIRLISSLENSEERQSLIWFYSDLCKPYNIRNLKIARDYGFAK